MVWAPQLPAGLAESHFFIARSMIELYDCMQSSLTQTHGFPQPPRDHGIISDRSIDRKIGKLLRPRSLAESTGADSFRKWDNARQKFRGGFLISAFEAIALGIGFNIDRVRRVQGSFDVASRVKQVWNDDDFVEWTGIGRSASSRIPRSIPIGRRIFRP